MDDDDDDLHIFNKKSSVGRRMNLRSQVSHIPIEITRVSNHGLSVSPASCRFQYTGFYSTPPRLKVTSTYSIKDQKPKETEKVMH